MSKQSESGPVRLDFQRYEHGSRPEITDQFQNLLNTCWYRLALTTIIRLDRWPNLTTGRLGPIPAGLYTDEEGRSEQYSRQAPIIESREQQEKPYYRETLV